MQDIAFAICLVLFQNYVKQVKVKKQRRFTFTIICAPRDILDIDLFPLVLSRAFLNYNCAPLQSLSWQPAKLRPHDFNIQLIRKFEMLPDKAIDTGSAPFIDHNFGRPDFAGPVDDSCGKPSSTSKLIVLFLIPTAMLGGTIYCFWTGLVPDVGCGYLSFLIPLVMVFGEPLLFKAMAVCLTGPLEDMSCFSCGWLLWSFKAMLSALSGMLNILPEPEIDCKLLNLKSGRVQQNRSFVISRIFRDLETKYENQHCGLTIEVLQVRPPREISTLRSVMLCFRTLAIMITQFQLANDAFWWRGCLAPMLLFVTATFLMIAVTDLPVLATQNLQAIARHNNSESSCFALMRGNQNRYISIIVAKPDTTINMEILAGPRPSRYDYKSKYEVYFIVLTFFIFSTITFLSASLSDESALYMLAILGLGTIGNILIVKRPRLPWMYGINIEPVQVIQGNANGKRALTILEEKYPGFGTALEKEISCEGLVGHEKSVSGSLYKSP